MGNNIFVVRSKNELFIAEYYLRQEKTITSFATLKTCLAHVNKVIDEEYIIQEAIDVMQYDNQVFAIRAIAFNTGQKWLCLTEVRISNKSNAVSNGGSFEVTLDFLLKILPQKEAVAILEKIKKDTIDLTMKINSEYDDTIVELAFDVLVDKKGNIYIAEINIKPGLTGINLDNDFFNMNDYEKYLYKELAVRQGEYLAKALLYKDSNKSFQNSITSISDKQLSSYQKSIGMLYHEHHNTKMNQGKFNIILHRASVLAPELAKYNYKLILYSPINVDKETNIVAGYIWEDNEFKPTLTTLPKINHDFYIGPDDLNSYRPFQPWAKERGYKLYPTRPLRILTQNKLLSAEILAEFNSSVVPYTERFRGTEEQLQKYLAKTPIVFIKPQFGSMGNKIFVVKSKNDKFIAEYYLQQKKNSNFFFRLSRMYHSH
jgi:hypothetical protein